MAELDIASQNMYGYRHTGPNDPPTRVRIVAGTQIPPDLVDFEDAGDDWAEANPEPITPVVTQPTDEEEGDLEGMSKDELRTLADERGVEVGSNATKADIVAALQAA